MSATRRQFVVGSLALTAVGGVAAAPAGAVPRWRPTVRTVDAWVDGYLSAWRARDPGAAARLFSADAVYQVTPGDPTQCFTGRARIADYWATVTAAQRDIETRKGVPIVGGFRASVEIWVNLQIPSGPLTIVETNELTFDRSGLCTRNVEYSNVFDERRDPPRGWGR